MTRLRQLRLDRVRADLLAGASVTELGRFSAAYRERLGELPSQTGERA